VPLKRQRRFAKYEREALRCGEEINALSRFTSAQVTAFRKIIKKYKVGTCNSAPFCHRTSRQDHEQLTSCARFIEMDRFANAGLALPGERAQQPEELHQA
jgi:hypothetical protein